MTYYSIIPSNSKTGFSLKISENDDTKIIDLNNEFFEKKSGKWWVRLPECVHHVRKLLDKSILLNEEMELGNFRGRTRTNSAPSEPKIDLAEKYLSADELEVYRKLQRKIALGADIEKARQKKEAADAELARLMEALG